MSHLICFFPKLAKLGSFNQMVPSKPIGLLKRGLGGVVGTGLNQEINDINVLSTSQRGDHFHGQNKVAKKNTIHVASITDLQQRMGKLFFLFDKLIKNY